MPVEDGVCYALPVIDGIVNRLLVRPRIEEIFAFRRQKIIELFGK